MKLIHTFHIICLGFYNTVFSDNLGKEGQFSFMYFFVWLVYNFGIVVCYGASSSMWTPCSYIMDAGSTGYFDQF